MKKSVKKNYLYNLIYQLLTIIFPIITTPYIARVLGATGIGIYSYTISIATYFILFGTVGISLYGQREMAYVQSDSIKRNQLFTELTIIKVITMSLSILIFIFTFCLNNEYNLYYRILILELLSQILDISWIYQGLEEFKTIMTRNIIIKLISVISIFLFIKKANDVWIYSLIYVTSTLFGNITLWFKRGTLVNFVKIPVKNLKKHFLPILSFFIPQIAIQVYTIFDKTMIGFILSDMNQVGFYEQSQKVVKLLLTIITSLGTVMMPRIANCFAVGNDKQIKEYIIKSFTFLFFLAFPMIFGIIAVASNFVPIFFGAGYESVVPIISSMSVVMLFIGISNIIGNQLLLTTKNEKKYTISVLCGAFLNFFLNLVLIPSFGALGATIATILAELLVATIQLFYIRKEFNLIEIFSISYKYFLSSLVMLIGCVLISFLHLSHFYILLLQIIIGSCIYLLMLLLLKDNFLKYIFQIFKSFFIKVKKL